MRPILRLVSVAALVTAVLNPAAAGAQAPYPYPYPYVYQYGPEADVRVNFKPREASVYVDGYYAGKVDDFDGTFQRLHVEPGSHELTIYLKGFRTIHQKLYLSAGRTQTLEGSLEALDPDEAQEPEPRPAQRPEGQMPDTRRPPQSTRAPERPLAPRPPPAPERPDSREPEQAPPQTTESRYGTLSIRVQPTGSVVFVDGERWTGPADTERLIIQVPAGRHHVEVERNGYERFTAEVDVQRGRTEDMNITLAQQR